MSVIFNAAKILFAAGKVAMDLACCCDGCACCLHVTPVPCYECTCCWQGGVGASVTFSFTGGTTSCTDHFPAGTYALTDPVPGATGCRGAFTFEDGAFSIGLNITNCDPSSYQLTLTSDDEPCAIEVSDNEGDCCTGGGEADVGCCSTHITWSVEITNPGGCCGGFDAETEAFYCAPGGFFCTGWCDPLP